MTEMNASQRAAQLQEQADKIISAWRQELDKLDLTGTVQLPEWEQASFELQRDPASAEDSLKGSWRGHHNVLLGSVVFHADGAFFGEYDVVCPHPHRDGWFIEAVVAWGRDGVIKSELRMLPMVE